MTKRLWLILSALLICSSSIADNGLPRSVTEQIVSTWKIIKVGKDIDNETKLTRLPKEIAWTPSSLDFDIQLSGSFKLINRPLFEKHKPNFEPRFTRSSNGDLMLIVIDTKSQETVFQKTYPETSDYPFTKLTVGTQGLQALELHRTICGDSDRFVVNLVEADGTGRMLSDCSASASLSPDGKKVFLESDLVDLTSWVAYPLPEDFPSFWRVLAWSKDSRRVALDAGDEIILVHLK